MTRKDYVVIAEAVREAARLVQSQDSLAVVMFTATRLARRLKSENVRFDTDRFLEACKP